MKRQAPKFWWDFEGDAVIIRSDYPGGECLAEFTGEHAVDDASALIRDFEDELRTLAQQRGKAGGVPEGYALVPKFLADQLSPGNWREVWIGTKKRKLTVTLNDDYWHEVMGRLAATPPAHSRDAGVKDGGWRDIYSIPKDQTRVELLAANGKRDVGNYYHIDNPSYGFMEHLITDGGHGNYTRWRPLAPQSKDAT